MPEMPEVEIVRRTLVDKVAGRTIKEVEFLLARLVKWPSPGEFQAVLTNRKIITLTRRGKYLLFHLDDGQVLVIHLRMTGRLQYIRTGMEKDKFTRIIFKLDNGDLLIYADTRTLGTLYLMPMDELWRISGLATMGPEPLTPEFSLDYLKNMLKKHHGKIKAILLNQKYIGGLGNIYVDESIAIAGIHPERIASSLSESENEKLYHAINKVIADGIEHGGTTFRDYRDGIGRSGTHQHHLIVYGRKGEPCLTCGIPIVWKEVSGRGSHFCPKCQG
ncbi:DNA-formamidopyrimidine glycosylase [Pelosinus sp. IPA-1]|uniref:DNA-formamidopyrimidine glycosylase n=1 Tax=Pelosinus sp. IPA-1 TaxID=3029569 RepID=UPI002436166C|nr:DNA-formamidopyrimidine glycosylase [Pelosinus sp. IPA-1]GMB00322.1 formamidopyrimidine-DNA glycosylase [Pelosinus sp. IPA-1]